MNEPKSFSLMNMIKQLALFFILPVLFFGCPSDDDSNRPITDPTECFPEEESEIIFALLAGPTTSQPSKVSVFFKLDDDEGQPVPRLTESDFIFFEEGSNDDCPTLVSTDEADRKIQNSPQNFQYATTLVLDLSGSVINNNLEELKSAAISFIEVIMPENSGSGFNMEIFWFDGGDGINELVTLTDERNTLIAGVNSINSSISNDSSTDLFGAVIESVQTSENTFSNLPTEIASASIVLFTDGRDRAQRDTREDAYSSIQSLNESITAFTIGLGNEINVDDLENIGKDGFKQVNNIDELISTFQEVGNLVIDEADSYYNFEYCSPIRNGSAELFIEARSGSKEGFIRLEYNGDGFMGGCEL